MNVFSYRIPAIALAVVFSSACSAPEGESTSPPPPRETQQTSEAAPPSLPRQDLPQPVLESLRTALAAYDEIRELLAADRLEGIDASGSQMAAAFRAAEDGVDAPELRSILDEAARVADSLTEAEDLEPSREAFGEASRLLLVIANVDPRLLEGWHVFRCPMTSTFEKWAQPSSEIENPYMGQEMLSCGEPSDLSVQAPRDLEAVDAHVAAAHEGEIAYYTCSMHPSVQRAEPSTCPICSMNLVPVTREEVATGVIFVDSQRRQAIGVRTAPVATRPASLHIRAVGKVVYDETRLADVTVKYRGWVGELHADATGVRVRRGEPLFTLYSPELYTAQQELLTALASQQAARTSSVPNRADYLVEAARTRLRLWDLEGWQIDEIAETGKPLEYVPIVSPVSGYVIEKNIVEGAAVEPGKTLYRIAGLDTIWIEADLYESELALIEIGQKADVTLAYLPGKQFTGRVSFLYPYLEGKTRTGRVRVELPNPGLELKPDMYASVDFGEERGERLTVPEEAVIYAGPRRLVFVDLGEGRLRPQEIEVGIKSGDHYEVLSGLEEGDVVVTSGNFLIAAESRLKSATSQW